MWQAAARLPSSPPGPKTQPAAVKEIAYVKLLYLPDSRSAAAVKLALAKIARVVKVQISSMSMRPLKTF